MAVFVMADTHLSRSVGKPMDIFGSRWQNYEEKLSERWGGTIGRSDTVVLPGDISWGMTLEEAESDLRFLNSLPGKKILLKGNHDLWWPSTQKFKSFLLEKGFDSLQFLYNDALLCENYIICGSRGWYADGKKAASLGEADAEKIIAREVGRLKLSLNAGLVIRKKYNTESESVPELLAFLHFPPYFADYICSDLIHVLEEYGVKRCYFGHIHGMYQVPAMRKYMGIEFRLISADYLDFFPFQII